MANDLKTKIEYLIPELDPVRNEYLSPNDTPIQINKFRRSIMENSKILINGV